MDKDWGVRPILFKIGKIVVPSYSFFVALAIFTGLSVYIIEAGKKKKVNKNSFYIVFAALAFGTLGAKIPIWIAHYKDIINSFPNISPMLSGRTIVGGLIGGTIGVTITKKKLKIKDRIGNEIAPAAALGMAIGRIGCFLNGCCYGVATNCKLGVDFGDGILRHPTQLYEAAFDLLMFVYIMKIKNKVTEPGKLFRIFVSAYFVYRFLIEFIRVEPKVFLGLTGFQIGALIGLIYINRNIFAGDTNNGK